MARSLPYWVKCPPKLTNQVNTSNMDTKGLQSEFVKATKIIISDLQQGKIFWGAVLFLNASHGSKSKREKIRMVTSESLWDGP